MNLEEYRNIEITEPVRNHNTNTSVKSNRMHGSKKRKLRKSKNDITKDYSATSLNVPSYYSRPGPGQYETGNSMTDKHQIIQKFQSTTNTFISKPSKSSRFKVMKNNDSSRQE